MTGAQRGEDFYVRRVRTTDSAGGYRVSPSVTDRCWRVTDKSMFGARAVPAALSRRRSVIVSHGY